MMHRSYKTMKKKKKKKKKKKSTLLFYLDNLLGGLLTTIKICLMNKHNFLKTFALVEFIIFSKEWYQ